MNVIVKDTKQAVAKPAFRREAMRIAGKQVVTDDIVEVFNPYTNEVVGTVPAARPEHAARKALNSSEKDGLWPRHAPQTRISCKQYGSNFGH